MPYNLIEEEEEKARVILRRWYGFSLSHHQLVGIIGFFCMSISNHFVPKHSSYKDTLFFIGCLLCLYAVYGDYLLRRRFVAEMTIEEIETLQRASIGMSKGEKKTIKSLIHKHQKIHPRREYLRASSRPAHDDSSLLRAAASHDDSAPKELLRPTETP